MSQFAELPDGTRLEFPDDAPVSVIQGAVKKMLGAASTPGVPMPLPNGLKPDKEPITLDELLHSDSPRSLGSSAKRDELANAVLRMSRPSWDEKAGGAADLGGYAMGALAPMAAMGAFTAPAATALGVATGTAGSSLAGAGASALHGGPGVQRLAELVGGALGASASSPLMSRVSNWLMGSALNPSGVMPSEKQAMVKTMLDKQIPVNEAGIASVKSKQEGLMDQIANVLSRSNETIEPARVKAYIDNVPHNSILNERDLKAMEAAKAEIDRRFGIYPPSQKPSPILDPNGQPIMVQVPGSAGRPVPVSEAQAMKQETYQKLKDQYGELGNTQIEMNKQLARGLKEGIDAKHPEVAPLNQQWAEYQDVLGPMEAAVKTRSDGGQQIPNSKLEAARRASHMGADTKSRMALLLERQNSGPGGQAMNTAPIINAIAQYLRGR